MYLSNIVHVLADCCFVCVQSLIVALLRRLSGGRLLHYVLISRSPQDCDDHRVLGSEVSCLIGGVGGLYHLVEPHMVSVSFFVDCCNGQINDTENQRYVQVRTLGVTHWGSLKNSADDDLGTSKIYLSRRCDQVEVLIIIVEILTPTTVWYPSLTR